MSMPSVRGTISEPIYYHREYENDVGNKAEENSWGQQCQRVATVALPFFSLYKPLSLPISLGMGALRVFSNANQLLSSIQQGNGRDIPCQLLQTAIAVGALAGTFFAHPAGMLITTGHDIMIETISLVGYLQRGEHKKALESCANIINNALYLALFTHGGLELAIASLAMQIMLGLYHSHGEFQKGNYLEASGHLLMAMVRGNQMAGQVKVLQVKWKLEAAMKNIQKDSFNKCPKDRGASHQHESRAGNKSNKTVLCLMQEMGTSSMDSELIDILIRYGNNPDGIPALHYATKMGDERAVELLLDHGASAFTKDHLNRNCLHFAVDSGNLNLVKKFTSFGVSPNEMEASRRHCTAFTLAIEDGKNEIAKYLYDHGGEVYTQGDSEGRAWVACFKVGNFDMVKFFVERGAEIRNEYESSEFSRVASWHLLYGEDRNYNQHVRSEKVKCLDFLVSKRLVYLPIGPDQMWFENIFPEGLEYLLDNKYFSPNDRFKNNYPVLFYAAKNRDFGIELTEILLKRDVNVRLDADFGRTILQFLAPSHTLNASELQKQKALFSLLIRSGADTKGILSRVEDSRFKEWLIACGVRD